jgi:RHS repeat-associated protein
LLGGWLPQESGGHVPVLYGFDGNGNVTGLVDAVSGQVAARYDYTPFGQLAEKQGGELADRNRYRFSTKPQEEDLGWYYYGFRLYRPDWGRWISRDPIEEQGGENLYAFVGNRTTGRVDRLGLLDFIAIGEKRVQISLPVISPITGWHPSIVQNHFVFERWRALPCVNPGDRKWDREEFIEHVRRNHGGIAVTRGAIEASPATNWTALVDTAIPIDGAGFGTETVPLRTNVWITYIKHNDSQAVRFVAVYAPKPDGPLSENRSLVDKKWEELKSLAERYPYGERQNPKSPGDLQRFPQSVYEKTGNNSTTFAKWLARQASFSWPSNLGFSQGNDPPQSVTTRYYDPRPR